MSESCSVTAEDGLDLDSGGVAVAIPLLLLLATVEAAALGQLLLREFEKLGLIAAGAVAA